MQEVLHAFGIDWRLIVIQVFNFTLLMGVLWYFLYTPVLNIIKERREKIEKGIQDAEDAATLKANAETERLTILTDANKEAELAVERAKKFADEKSSGIVASAESKAETIVADARERGEEQQKRLEKESEAEIAKLAVLAAERVLKEKQ